jgi:hypothetical protein
MIKGFPFHRMGLWAKRLEPYATIVQVIAIIAASLLAIAQLHTGNHQTKIANTLMFLNNMQTSEFQNKYFESITWLQDSTSNPLLKDNPPPEADKKITYVLNWYSNLWILYRKGVLDKDTIEDAVGVDIAQYWLLSNCVLTSRQLRGYEDLNRFYEELEKCDAVRNSKLFKNMKEKLQCQH